MPPLQFFGRLLLGGGVFGMSLKKKRLSIVGGDGGQSRDREMYGERKVELDVSVDGIGASREKNGLFGFDLGHQKAAAKHVWKKQVWIVLSLDLIVCSILFGIR